MSKFRPLGSGSIYLIIIVSIAVFIIRIASSYIEDFIYRSRSIHLKEVLMNNHKKFSLRVFKTFCCFVSAIGTSMIGGLLLT